MKLEELKERLGMIDDLLSVCLKLIRDIEVNDNYDVSNLKTNILEADCKVLRKWHEVNNEINKVKKGD